MNSWLVVSNMSFIFHFIYEWDVILPIDFHIFQDGWNHQPGKKMAISFRCMISDIMHVLILNNQVSCYWPGFLRKWRGNSPLTKTGCGWFSPSRSLVCTSVDARWCPSSIAKLVNITPISLWFMVDITNELMGVINQLITGGHHIVSSVPSQFLSCFFSHFLEVTFYFIYFRGWETRWAWYNIQLICPISHNIQFYYGDCFADIFHLYQFVGIFCE